MKINIFVKTFLTLLFSFSVLFVASTFYFYTRFSSRYIEENISAVKNAILDSTDSLASSNDLNDTLLNQVSSETQFIRFKNNNVESMIGPNILSEDQIFMFVISIYDNEDLITEGDLSYTITLDDDIYIVNYIYQFASSDYLLILTKIQSLRNIDRVLDDITITQAIFLFVTITLISLIISHNISHPIKRINRYAKSIAKLDFSSNLVMDRKDEFNELISSLNEMAFNLKKSYSELTNANKQLAKDIEFEKTQEEKKKALIMTINHELKTPVSVIKGMVEGMIDGVGRYKEKEKYLNEVLNQLELIEKITKDLTYSLKLEDLAKVNDQASLNSLENSLEPIKELAKQKHVNLSLEIKDYRVGINEELLGILVSNLLKNAINYTLDNLVSLKVSRYTDKVYLEIRNRGVIEEKDLEKIFEPYFRVSLEKEGSGLGLFIVKQICEIYNCDYKIYNDNGYVVSEIGFKKL